MKDVCNNAYLICKNVSWQVSPDNQFVYIQKNNCKDWFYLDEVSLLIWLCINKRLSLKQIVNSVSNEYKLDYEMVYKDVVDMIKQLVEKHLIYYVR